MFAIWEMNSVSFIGSKGILVAYLTGEQLKKVLHLHVTPVLIRLTGKIFGPWILTVLGCGYGVDHGYV